jgi:hypothetical protein
MLLYICTIIERYGMCYREWHFVTNGCQNRMIPAAARFKAWVRGLSLAAIAGSNPTGGMDVSCYYYVFSVRGFCNGPISFPEQSYRMWCV